MITQIKRFAITQLTLAAHSQFHEQVLKEISAYEVAVLHLEELAAAYGSAVSAEKIAVNRPTAFAETPLMVETDHKRDQAVSMVFNMVSLYRKSTEVTEIAAAQRLSAILAPYQGIQIHEYYRETSEIDGMLASLATALPADITLFNLSSVIAQVKTHNDAFKLLMTDRSGDVVNRTPVRLTDSQDLRHSSDTLYHEIIQRVNAFAIAIPSPELEAFAVAINAIVLQLQRVIASQGRSQKEETEPAVE